MYILYRSQSILIYVSYIVAIDMWQAMCVDMK